MDDGRGAHDTRLQRHVKSSAVEPIRTQGFPASAQCFDLGVRGGIVTGDGPVRRDREYRVALHQNGTYGYFAGLLCSACGFERQPHEIDVVA